jgi:hypothetical protein
MGMVASAESAVSRFGRRLGARITVKAWPLMIYNKKYTFFQTWGDVFDTKKGGIRKSKPSGLHRAAIILKNTLLIAKRAFKVTSAAHAARSGLQAFDADGEKTYP